MPEQGIDKPEAESGAVPNGAEAKSQPTPEVGDSARWSALETDLAEARDRLLRSAAEMENLRRRTERDVADARQYAVTGFASDLLSVVDNLRRAIETAPPEARQSGGALAGLIEGVEMTERELLRVLERHGVRRMEAVGQKFDPSFHQAMFEVESADAPAGTIVQVAQPGYAIGERVLRPALVGIARAKKTGAEKTGAGKAEGEGPEEQKEIAGVAGASLDTKV